jgi:hypothetical protein
VSCESEGSEMMGRADSLSSDGPDEYDGSVSA